MYKEEKVIGVARLIGIMSLVFYIMTTVFAYERTGARIVISSVAVISYLIILIFKIAIREEYWSNLAILFLSILCIGVSFI